MRNIFEQLTGKPRGAINTDPLDRMPTQTLSLGRMADPPDPAEFDAAKAPTLIAFTDCTGVQVSGLMLQHAAYTPQVYTRCADLSVSDVIFVPSPQATQAAETEQCSRVAMTNNLTYPY